MNLENEGKRKLPGGTLHLVGSERTVNRLAITDCGPEEPKGSRVSVWELENWLNMMKLMICFLINTEGT